MRQVRASVGRVLPEDDMISLGNEGLAVAMMRFEPGRGVEFAFDANVVASPTPTQLARPGSTSQPRRFPLLYRDVVLAPTSEPPPHDNRHAGLSIVRSSTSRVARTTMCA